MSTIFTRESVLAAFEKIVAEYGADYVYPGVGDICMYGQETGDDLAPSCVIGHVVNVIDPPLFQVIASYEVEYGESEDAESLFLGDWTSWRASDDRRILTEDEGLADAVLRAQIAQDEGATWGEALAIFKTRLDMTADNG